MRLRLNDITYSRFIDGCNKAGINQTEKFCPKLLFMTQVDFRNLLSKQKQSLLKVLI